MGHDKARAEQILRDARNNLTPTERQRAEEVDEFCRVQTEILNADYGTEGK